MRNILLVDKI